MNIRNGPRRAAAQAVLALLIAAAAAFAATPDTRAPSSVTPKEHQRGTDQTFLTYPEWFLVHSPAEYAAFVKDRAPSGFPFLGHICQFWGSYGAVNRAIKDYPFNFGYHVMVMVIGTSTTVEYALRSVYEMLIGRVAELTGTYGATEEDRLAARVAQDYVDFIRVQPWYEYDFLDKLAAVWTRTGWWGPELLRKWERKYALTTEYSIKAVYAWLIKKATKASYDEPLPVTAVLVDRLPAGIEKELPELKVLEKFPDGSTLMTVPRYFPFKRHASLLAARGAGFVEIAGNRSVILVSALVPVDWKPASSDRVLFEQPIITRPATKRVALVVPVKSLAATLNSLNQPGSELEHVYDY